MVFECLRRRRRNNIEGWLAAEGRSAEGPEGNVLKHVTSGEHSNEYEHMAGVVLERTLRGHKWMALPLEVFLRQEVEEDHLDDNNRKG